MRQRCFRPLACLVLAVGSFFSVAVADAAIDAPFRDLSAESLAGLPPRGEYEAPLPLHFRALEVDLGALEDLLALAPAEGGAAALAAPLILTLPYPDGSDQRFRVEESPIMEAALARRFPEIRTFTVQGIDDPAASGRVSLTPLGFHAMVLASAGTIYIDPYRRWQGEVVLSYLQSQAIRSPGDAHRCEFQEDEAPDLGEIAGRVAEAEASAVASGSTLRTYRLALAATGEYSTRVCLPNPVAVACAMDAIVVSMNRVGGIYEREVAVRMVLIANNDLVVYTNGTTDPYTNNDGFAMLAQNQTNLTAVIGSANYDIGHVFSTGGGGVASLSVPCGTAARPGASRVCPTRSATPSTSISSPTRWGISGAAFTPSTARRATAAAATAAPRRPTSRAAARRSWRMPGICGAENLQPHSDDYFHTQELRPDRRLLDRRHGELLRRRHGHREHAAEADAGAAFTIPKQTPFTLTGSATDPDGDSLTYCGRSTTSGPRRRPTTTSPRRRPIFRSFVPLTVPSRTFPRSRTSWATSRRSARRCRPATAP